MSKKHPKHVPLPTRQQVLEFIQDSPGRVGKREIARAFNLTADQRPFLRQIMKDLETEGLVQRGHKRRLSRPGALPDVTVVEVTGTDVNGELIGKPMSWQDKDLPPPRIFLLPVRKGQPTVGIGDKVLCKLVPSGDHAYEGRVVKKLGDTPAHVLGILEVGVNGTFLRATNHRDKQDYVVARGDLGGAEPGTLVEAEILPGRTYGLRQARVITVLGDMANPRSVSLIAIHANGIPTDFPQGALDQAAGTKAAPMGKRVDLRDIPLVTIDGEDARDFDDAVYCEPRKASGWRLFAGGWKLYVAIADVSHYVPLGSELDAEAELRGTSVYFPSEVIPMLPEAISNGLCSLMPEVDRLAMVCEMTISKNGELTDFEFYEAVIHSHARLTYNKVSSMLEHPRSREGKALSSEYAEVLPHLKNLYDLYKALAKARHGRGAIDFETTETRMLFGEDRKITEILPTTRNDAHKIIEECMLCANVATARFLQDLEIPGLYRVHDGPKPEKVERLRQFLGSMGMSLTRKKGDPTPEDYAAVLEKVQDRPDAQLIQTVMLRSLSQAVYTPHNAGHFGLNYEAYTHFTSPIRRYPDLLVHRAIRSVIRSRKKTDLVRRCGAGTLPKAAVYPYDLAALERLGEQCSQNERRADEATRDVVSWLKCEFMQDRVGENFDGLVTAVTGFGLFVELTDIYVEGLVHITALPADYYNFDAVHHSLVGERAGRTFRLGDSIRVQVVRVDLDERKIDFEMASDRPVAANANDSRAVREKLLSEARKAQAAARPGSKPKSGKPPARGRDGKPTPAAGRTGAKRGATEQKPAGKKPSAPRKRKTN